MIVNFDKSLEYVLAHEGGYVNHPKDPGGATNKGVTQKTYNDYLRRVGVSPRSVKFISDDEVKSIYERQYWDVLKCDELPSGVDYAVFDFGVNSGPSRSAKFLQRIVGAKQDGIIGSETIGLVKSLDPKKVIEDLCEMRMNFVRGLSTFDTFGRGWTRRIMGEFDGTQSGDYGVIDRAVVMSEKTFDKWYDPPKTAIHGKATEPEPRKSVAQSKTVVAQVGQWIGTSGAGVAVALGNVPERVQLAAIGLAAVAIVCGVVVFRERIKKWADGDR